MHSLVTRFMALFSGYSRAYGIHEPSTDPDDRGKRKGKSWTKLGAPTAELYEAHLMGKQGLGIVLLKDGDRVSFGAIDYDVYGASYSHVALKAAKAGLPVVAVESKSNGLHVFCFTREPVRATSMRARMNEFAVLLSLGTLPNGQRTEIFPKQSARANEQDIGGWINLPYYGALKHPDPLPGRTAYGPEGRALNLAEFLDYAEQQQVDDFAKFDQKWSINRNSQLFENGPPCLQCFEVQGGFPDGGKRNGMFNVAVYLRKRYGAEWKQHIPEYNDALASLKFDELTEITTSVDKKPSYNYTCKQQPIAAMCDKKSCVKRTYGVTGGNPDDTENTIEFTGLTKYDPNNPWDEPSWALEVDGHRIAGIEHKTLVNRAAFNQLALGKIHIVPVVVKQDTWERTLEKLMETQDVVILPESATPSGMLWQRIVSYLQRTAPAETEEQIYLGRPFHRPGSVLVRAASIIDYLRENRTMVKEERLYHLMTLRGAHMLSLVLRAGSAPSDVWEIPDQEGAFRSPDPAAEPAPEPAPPPTGQEPF